ncbi:MAG: hypothetical protein K0U98_03700 [Deltaproteobacteria bacterium]|nr:hypothetical protein [Deltaproteobacteria bacterium]
MIKRSPCYALAACLALAVAFPGAACDKTSVTTISLLGVPTDPCKDFTTSQTVKHTIYYCVGDFECHDKEIEFTFNTGNAGKDKKALAKELADHIRACMPANFTGKVKAVDNVVSITKTNSCPSTGDPCTDDKPCKQPKNAKKSTFHTAQSTSRP